MYHENSATFYKKNIQLVCPYPFPRMAYNLHWRCLHAALDCASIHSGALAVPISLPSLPSIPKKWLRDSAGPSALLLPPNGDCLRLLRAVHIPSHDGHAQCVLTMATLNSNFACAKPAICLAFHHPQTLAVGTVLSPSPKALLHHRQVLPAVLIKVFGMTFGCYQVCFS